MSATATMYRVDPTEAGWRAHHRRFVMRRSCAGGIAYVLRSAGIRRRGTDDDDRAGSRISVFRRGAAASGDSVQSTAHISPTHLPRGFHGLFSKHAEQHELVAAVGEPRAHPLALGERQCLGDSFVAGPECELLGSRWCPKHEDHTWITVLPANDNIVLVRMKHHEPPVLRRLVRRATYDGSRRASSEETQHYHGCRKAAADPSNRA